MKENVFFAESGLTSTSANHIANLAKATAVYGYHAKAYFG